MPSSDSLLRTPVVPVADAADAAATYEALAAHTDPADCRPRVIHVVGEDAEETRRGGETLDRFESLAAAAGVDDAGEALVADCRRRLDAVSDRVAAVGDGDSEVASDTDRPVVYCEEWSEPPMAAGNWVPDAVAAAGGHYPFVEPGERSQEVDRETVADVDPDHAVLHICGTGDDVSTDRLRERGWSLDATVHVVDDSLLNQPSPKLIDGIELLAERLHEQS